MHTTSMHNLGNHCKKIRIVRILKLNSIQVQGSNSMWRGEKKDDTFDTSLSFLRSYSNRYSTDESSIMIIIEFISWRPCPKIFSCRVTISFFVPRDPPSPSLSRFPGYFFYAYMYFRKIPRHPPLAPPWTWDPIFSRNQIESKVSFSSPLYVCMYNPSYSNTSTAMLVPKIN